MAGRVSSHGPRCTLDRWVRLRPWAIRPVSTPWSSLGHAQTAFQDDLGARVRSCRNVCRRTSKATRKRLRVGTRTPKSRLSRVYGSRKEVGRAAHFIANSNFYAKQLAWRVSSRSLPGIAGKHPDRLSREHRARNENEGNRLVGSTSYAREVYHVLYYTTISIT